MNASQFSPAEPLNFSVFGVSLDTITFDFEGSQLVGTWNWDVEGGTVFRGVEVID